MSEKIDPRDCFEKAVSFIGRDWLEEKDREYYEESIQQRPPPVVQKYHRALRELEYVDDENKDYFPNFSMPTFEIVNIGRFLQVLEDHAAIVDPESFDELDDNLSGRFAHRLQNPDEYEKALYELRTGAIYAVKGSTVQFIKETQDAKTPDILLRTPYKVFVECKRIDSASASEKKQQGINEVLQSKTANWIEEDHAIIFEYSRPPSRDEVEAIRNHLPKVVDRSSETVDLPFGTATIYNLKIIYGPHDAMFVLDRGQDVRAEYSELYDTYIQSLVSEEEEYGLDDLAFKINANRQTRHSFIEYSDFKFVGIIHDSDRDYVKRVLNQFDRAYGKFDKEHPNILHIDMPIRAETAYELAQNLRDEIGRALSSKRRISAVTLSLPLKIRNDTGAKAIRHQGATIRNLDPYSKLPKRFEVLGEDITEL